MIRYRTHSSLTATLHFPRQDQQRVFTIPSESVFTVRGRPDSTGLVEVEFQGKIASVFQQDLDECAFILVTAEEFND